MRARNARTERAAAVLTPAPSGSASASQSEPLAKPAVAAMRSTLASPMPRRGWLMMRRSAMSSVGLSSTLRYAIASLISARS